MAEAVATSFGPFDFTLTASVVARYREVLGYESAVVPAALVIRVLTEPAVLHDLRAAFGDLLPVHVSQSVTIGEGLEADCPYRVTLAATAPRPQRLRIAGTLHNARQTVAASFVSEFLLVQKPDAATV